MRPSIRKIGLELRSFVLLTYAQSTDIEASTRTFDDIGVAEQGRAWPEMEQSFGTSQNRASTALRNKLRGKCIHGENIATQNSVLVDDKQFTEVPLIGWGHATPPAMLYLDPSTVENDEESIEPTRTSGDLCHTCSHEERSFLCNQVTETEFEHVTESRPEGTNSETLVHSSCTAEEPFKPQETSHTSSRNSWNISLTECPYTPPSIEQEDERVNIQSMKQGSIAGMPEILRWVRPLLAKVLPGIESSDASLLPISMATQLEAFPAREIADSDTDHEDIEVRIPGSYISADGKTMDG